MSEMTSRLDADNNNEWEEREGIRHSFMNLILASAKRFQIDPFVAMEVPRRSKFRSEDFRDFTSDLDHYLMQMMIDNSLRQKDDSVSISPKSKDNIKTYIDNLRKCVDSANISNEKRDLLLKRLDEFENELNRTRLSYVAVARIVVEILAVPGALWATGEVAGKLANNILQVVGDSKEVESSQRQISTPAPLKALSPPRKETALTRAVHKANYDLDDDIPF